MKTITIMIAIGLIGGGATLEENPSLRNVTKVSLAKDLSGHISYIETLLPSADVSFVKNFLLQESKVSGDYSRSWYDRKASIAKFIEQDRKIQDWLKDWRSSDIQDAADFFVNAAENYKELLEAIGIEGDKFLPKAYALPFDGKYQAATDEEKLRAVYDLVDSHDPQKKCLL